MLGIFWEGSRPLLATVGISVGTPLMALVRQINELCKCTIEVE